MSPDRFDTGPLDLDTDAIAELPAFLRLPINLGRAHLPWTETGLIAPIGKTSQKRLFRGRTSITRCSSSPSLVTGCPALAPLPLSILPWNDSTWRPGSMACPLAIAVKRHSNNSLI